MIFASLVPYHSSLISDSTVFLFSLTVSELKTEHAKYVTEDCSTAKKEHTHQLQRRVMRASEDPTSRRYPQQKMR